MTIKETFTFTITLETERQNEFTDLVKQLAKRYQDYHESAMGRYYSDIKYMVHRNQINPVVYGNYVAWDVMQTVLKRIRMDNPIINEFQGI